ncbi:MAG: AI-2E family transporter YdiK [Nitrospirota bacterium]
MGNVDRDLPRDFLAVLFIGALIAASLWILSPFLVAIIWATTIVVATWPAMLAVQARLWDNRMLAVTVMTLVLLGVLILPVIALLGTIVANVDPIAAWVQSLAVNPLQPVPTWVRQLPVVGETVARVWEQVAAKGLQELLVRAAPYAADVTRWFVAQVGHLGVVIVQSLLTIVIAAILYARGESLTGGVKQFARRLAGAPGEAAVGLSARAIRGVALGVVVTAMVQAGLGGIGLAVAGVPFAPVLTTVMFLFSVAQIGAVPILVPAVAWLYWTGDATWGTVLLVVTIVVGTLDNVLRPLLITQGANLPFLLIFSGVIGGLIAFGLIGIFVGPVVLAVAHSLLEAWVRGEER